ncbi:MAG: exodeoxyribonuclease VII small subunit [Alistipes sp.]|nr:exodeoxyribonuclease VII small subunit [Alistipes sp.]
MAKKKTISYTDAIKELEQILDNLRSGKVEISDLPPTVKRANELVEECRRQLMKTRAEIENIANTSTPL